MVLGERTFFQNKPLPVDRQTKKIIIKWRIKNRPFSVDSFLKILEKNEREVFFTPVIECTSLVTEERRNLGNTKEEYLCIHIEERESVRVWWDSAHLC